MRPQLAASDHRSAPPTSAAAFPTVEHARYIDLGARVTWDDIGWFTSRRAPPDPEYPSATERLRLAHRAGSVRPWACRSCGQCWPCEVRLHLDEISAEARQRYAAHVHADWLAGTRTPRNG